MIPFAIAVCDFCGGGFLGDDANRLLVGGDLWHACPTCLPVLLAGWDDAAAGRAFRARVIELHGVEDAGRLLATFRRGVQRGRHGHVITLAMARDPDHAPLPDDARRSRGWR